MPVTKDIYKPVLSEILGVEVKVPRRSVQRGQELVRQWLKVRPDGKPGLLIHHRCKNLIRELTHYLKHEPGQGEHHAGVGRHVRAVDPGRLLDRQ